jgi:hypothetical protein
MTGRFKPATIARKRAETKRPITKARNDESTKKFREFFVLSSVKKNIK